MAINRVRDGKREEYIAKLFAQEDSHLKSIRSSLREDGKEGINVGPAEGKLLQFLVKLSGAKKIVEVGTLYGYSALWMARALPEDGKIYCLEKDEVNFKKSSGLLASSEVSDKIEVIEGDAMESLEKLSVDGPFDMAFIDANKLGYVNYFHWAKQNIRSGGLLVGDNTFLFGHLTGEAAPSDKISEKMISTMNEFNTLMSDEKHFSVSAMIPTIEGMTVAIKN